MGEQTKALILLLILVSLVGSITEAKVANAESRTLVVPDDYTTIQRAINAANKNDTVYVKRGTYEEQTLKIYTTISLIGESANTTKIILHPPFEPLFGSSIMVYDSPILIRANQVVVSGFTIVADGGSISAVGTSIQVNCNYLGISVSVKGDANQIVDNKFEQSGITVEGSYNSISQNIVIERGITCEGSFNRVIDNIIARKQLSENTGIVLSGVNNLIFNNKVINNSITLEGDSNFNIIGKNDCCSILISRSYNNTVFGNYVTGILGFVGAYNVFYRNYLQGILLGNQMMGTPDNIFYENNFDFAGGKDILVYTGVHDVQCVRANNSLTFDNGTVGNYWSDYLAQYPHATSSGSGIGDTPYVVYLTKSNSSSAHRYDLGDEYNYELTIIDRYPHMSPFNISDIEIELPNWEYPVLDKPLKTYMSSPQNKTYTTNSISLTFYLVEETSWMGYSLDGQDNVTITLNKITLSGLTDGSHNIIVYANDTIGNSGASETICFTIDSIAPVVLVLMPQNQTYHVSEIPLNLKANKEVTKITYCLDGQDNLTINGNTTLTGLSNGNHTITVYITDSAQNTVKSETITFTISKKAESEPNLNPDQPPISWTATAIVIIAAVVVASILIYYTKTRAKTE